MILHFAIAPFLVGWVSLRVSAVVWFSSSNAI